MLDTQAQMGEHALPVTLQTRLNPLAALDHAQTAAQKFAVLDSSGLHVILFQTGYVSAARTRPTLLCTPAPACLLPQITAAGHVLQAFCRQLKTTLFVLCGAERGCASRTRRRVSNASQTVPQASFPRIATVYRVQLTRCGLQSIQHLHLRGTSRECLHAVGSAKWVVQIAVAWALATDCAGCHARRVHTGMQTMSVRYVRPENRPLH